MNASNFRTGIDLVVKRAVDQCVDRSHVGAFGANDIPDGTRSTAFDNSVVLIIFGGHTVSRGRVWIFLIHRRYLSDVFNHIGDDHFRANLKRFGLTHCQRTDRPESKFAGFVRSACRGIILEYETYGDDIPHNQVRSGSRTVVAHRDRELDDAVQCWR